MSLSPAARMSALLAPLLLGPLVVAEASAMERRLWEVSVRRFEREDRSRDFPDDSVLFYGSSSIRLWRTIEQDMAPRPVIQRGYGGARLSDAVGYVERVVHPHEASAIVVFLANDIDGRRNQPTPERVGELFGELLAGIREAHPTTPVLWVEVTPTPSRFDLWPDVCRAQELIRERCLSDANAHFVSTSHVYLQDGQPRADLFVEDGLHQNAEGYALWQSLIKAALDEVVGPVQTPVAEPQTVTEDETRAAEVTG